jgi:hypothetical protein
MGAGKTARTWKVLLQEKWHNGVAAIREPLHMGKSFMFDKFSGIAWVVYKEIAPDGIVHPVL